MLNNVEETARELVTRAEGKSRPKQNEDEVIPRRRPDEMISLKNTLCCNQPNSGRLYNSAKVVVYQLLCVK